MSIIPIPNNSHTAMDPSYRYMRSAVITSKFGQHFVIDNLDTICSQIKVDKADVINFIPKYLKQSVKMFGDKVGTKVSSPEVYEEMIEAFIVKHVICQRCSLPEIEMDKTSENFMVCNGCGNNCDKSAKSTKSTKSSDTLTDDAEIKTAKVKKSAKETKKEAATAKKQAIMNARKTKSSKVVSNSHNLADDEDRFDGDSNSE
jgi:translation initiation factor 2 beta subunit (eIF-2beta)/eIF-5